MGGHMMGWGWGWDGGGLFAIGHLLWWAALVLVIVVGVRWLGRGDRGGEGGQDRALAILRERYARGEIDKAEFDARRHDLG